MGVCKIREGVLRCAGIKSLGFLICFPASPSAMQWVSWRRSTTTGKNTLTSFSHTSADSAYSVSFSVLRRLPLIWSKKRCFCEVFFLGFPLRICDFHVSLRSNVYIKFLTFSKWSRMLFPCKPGRMHNFCVCQREVPRALPCYIPSTPAY